jgi:hypothetical protein
MLKQRLMWLGMLLLCFAVVPNVWADSTLHIGPGAGTKCATGCAGDPNLLAGAKKIDIYQTSNGAPTLSQPVLLILGVPSQFDHFMPAMPITGAMSVNPYPGGTLANGTFGFAVGGTYGLIDPISDGFFGTMLPGQEVYSFLGLGGANNSNSFTNWAADDKEYLGLTVTGFDIHVYAINADLGPEGLINLSLVTNVPKGTYIVAYSQADGTAYSVPFTEAGLKCSY